MKYQRLAWVLGLAFVGCTVGGDDASGTGGAAGADGAVDAFDAGGDGAGDEDAATDTDETAVPEVEGVWAQVLVYGAINDIPAVGQMPGTTTTIQRITVQRSWTSLSMMAEPCAIEIDNGTPVIQTIVPDAFLASLGVSDRLGALSLEGGQWRFVQESKLQLRGVKLDAPQTEALPVEASDPRVWDQDADGHPGVTIRIAGMTDGEVYLVQRDIHALDGTVQGDRIDGLADWSTEQVVLGSDNPILDMQTASAKDPNAALSYFRSTRIEPNMDCVAILAQREQLFQR